MQKLDSFIETKKIPNIILHGPPGSGKKTLLNTFIQKIYNHNKSDINQYVMTVNCAYGKGIKFIREDIKGFAKTNIHEKFKSIVLLNAEKLTNDAQSALRRCIEQFSFNTRFFIITDNKYKLLKPILSRFCEIYISSPTNLHYLNMPSYEVEYERKLMLQTIMSQVNETNILDTTHLLYNSAFSALDISNYVETSSLNHLEKYSWIFYFYKIKGEFRNESLLIFILLHLFVFRKDILVNLFI